MWNLDILLPYVIGYSYAVLIGHFAVKYFADSLWRASGKNAPEDQDRERINWSPALTGIIERTLYISSLLAGYAAFVGFWIVVKISIKWKRWDQPKDSLRGRTIYLNFVNGCGMSILFAGVGFKIIHWILLKQYALLIAVPLLLIIATYLLAKWVRSKGL